jgi:hypothetical protein
MVVMIRRLLLLWLNRRDPALKIQQPVIRYSGYDEQKATAGYHRSRQQSATGRIYQTERHGNVLPMRRTK